MTLGSVGKVRVRLGGTLVSQAGGVTEFVVEARTIHELLQRLGEQHPALVRLIERGVSVAVNGRIYREAFQTPIPPDSEVYLLPALVGG